MIYEMTKCLQNEFKTRFPEEAEIKTQSNILNCDTNKKNYKKIMTRQKCSTLEDRIVHYAKKQRIMIEDADPNESGW